MPRSAPRSSGAEFSHCTAPRNSGIAGLTAALRIHAAFATREVDERARAILTDGDDEIRALAVRVVADAGSADPDTDAHALLALTGGLSAEVALHGAPVDRARRTLTAMLDRLAPATARGPAGDPE